MHIFSRSSRKRSRAAISHFSDNSAPTVIVAINSSNTRRVILSIAAGLMLLAAPSSAQEAAPVTTAPADAAVAPAPAGGQLTATVHPALPSKTSDLWLVPSESDRAARSIST